MKFQVSLLTLGASLINAVVASDAFLLTDSLVKRQNGAFIPGSSSTTCAAESKCGTKWCLRPGRGDLCCSEGYACPSTSYCLTKGYCCPLGLDLAACALANSVTLPADFNTKTIPAGAAASGAGASSFGSLSLSVPSARSSTSNVTRSSTSSFNGGVVGRPSATSASTQFTGAAATMVRQAAGGLAAAVAAVGYLV